MIRFFMIVLALVTPVFAGIDSVYPVYSKNYSFTFLLTNFDSDVEICPDTCNGSVSDKIQPVLWWNSSRIYTPDEGAKSYSITSSHNGPDRSRYPKVLNRSLIPLSCAKETGLYFEQLFYNERETEPFTLFFTNNRRYAPKDSIGVRNVPVHLRKEKREFKRLEIFHYDRTTGTDILLFRVPPSMYVRQSAEELLLLIEYIDWFFNTRLIPTGTKIQYRLPAFYVLGSSRYPVYLPEALLIADRRTIEDLLANWSPIIRRILGEIAPELIADLKSQLMDKLLVLQDSPLSEAVFINKFALKSGIIVQPALLMDRLRNSDITALTRRIKLLIEQEGLDLYWDTTKDVEDSSLNNLRVHFKLKVHTLNKTEGSRK